MRCRHAFWSRSTRSRASRWATEWATNIRPEFRFHDARHTAASHMVAQGVPLFDVSKILGHKSLQMTMRYAHFAPKAGRAAIDALERALG